jgi:hypothetical protein
LRMEDGSCTKKFAAQVLEFIRGLQHCGERDATGTRGDADRVRAERGHPLPRLLAGSFHLTSMT